VTVVSLFYRPVVLELWTTS